MSRWAGVLLFWSLEYAILAFLRTALELGFETWSEDGIWMVEEGGIAKRRGEYSEEKE